MGLSINFFGCSVIIIVLSYKSSTNTIKYIKYESGIYDNSQNSLIYYCWAICPAISSSAIFRTRTNFKKFQKYIYAYSFFESTKTCKVHGILQITHYGPWWGFPYYNLTAPVEIVPLYPRWAGLWVEPWEPSPAPVVYS